MVTELSNSRVLCTHAEQLGPEMNVLRTTVILGMYISKEVPELLPRIKDAMVNYINTNLLTWIRQSGGWVSTIPNITVMITIEGFLFNHLESIQETSTECGLTPCCHF